MQTLHLASPSASRPHVLCFMPGLIKTEMEEETPVGTHPAHKTLETGMTLTGFREREYVLTLRLSFLNGPWLPLSPHPPWGCWNPRTRHQVRKTQCWEWKSTGGGNVVRSSSTTLWPRGQKPALGTYFVPGAGAQE